MATTRNIVNNLDNQTIEGSLTITGTVNDINELVDLLNSDPNTNYLGTFAIDPLGEEGLILTMPQYLKNQFSPDGVLTFEVYAD